MRYALFTFLMAGLLVSGCRPTAVARPAPAPPVSAEVRIAKEAGWPVAIANLTGVRRASQDISLRFTLVNVSDRAIRRLYLTAYLRNSSGDPVLDERTRSIYRELDFAGPVRPGEVVWGEKAEIPLAFRHAQAATIHIRDLRVVFDDGRESPAIKVEGQQLLTGQIMNAGG